MMSPTHPHSPTPIALCIPEDADTEVLTHLEGYARTLKVVRRCADLVELEAAARARIAEIGVLSGNDPDCDRPFIDSLHEAGMKVILLQDYTPAGEAIGTHSLLELKPDMLAPAHDPEGIARALLSIAHGGHAEQSNTSADSSLSGLEQSFDAHELFSQSDLSDGTQYKDEGEATGRDPLRLHDAAGKDTPAAQAHHTEGDEAAINPHSIDSAESFPQEEENPGATPLSLGDTAWLNSATSRPQRGKIIAIWGTSGAPGRTTVAINLAAALHHSNSLPPIRTLLIDADTYAPSVAHALGMSTDVSSLSAIARYAARGDVHAEHIEHAQQTSDEGIPVITGLSTPHRWREASPSALTQCLRAAREHAEYIIVDCASGTLDPLDDFGRFNAGRDEATAAVLKVSDLILVVARSDAEGLHRLMYSLEWLRAHISGPQVHIVANMVCEERAGSRPAQAIAQALAPYLPGEDISLISDDPQILSAQLQGRSLMRGDHKSLAARDFEELSQRLIRLLARNVQPASADQLPKRAHAHHRKIRAPRMLSLAHTLRKRGKAQTRDGS